MALQTENPPAAPSAQLVGNAFVEQYYHILHHSPESVYRFYQDSSVLSRPDSNGVMTSVTTMQGINEKIISLDYKDYKAEIKTADAQKSFNDGVTVLVTGCLTGKDNLRRKFAQSFFLAPQDNGFFVLNDVFRYVEDDKPLDDHAVHGVDDVTTVPLTPDRVLFAEPIHISDPPATDPETSTVEEDQNVVEKSHDPSQHERLLAIEKEAVPQPKSHSNGNDVSTAVEPSSSPGQDDAPKKSYASIVRVTKGSSGLTKVYVPTNTIKAVPKTPENQSIGLVVPTSVLEASAPSSVGTPESSNTQEEEGYSIYIRNLPLGVTVEQLDLEFKKFGPIKQGGIQVRNNKQQGYCFGFVEFHSLNSMNSAIQASPITIGGRKAVVEIKRTTTRVGSSGRGRFSSGRGSYRNDSFKSRGNYGGVRGFSRNEYGSWGDFSGRGRGSVGRGEGYQQGRGRGGRPSGPKQNVSS
ncbi:nuclear transport factor 2-like isoform X2 [Alnus glutinosa]|uniref:nuclear transport factor 2-like isoform X2 n=1 Tax=Alnus glutinosa TaxID=3517 RepID=UPI002D77E0CF|nr:nuclear transport factor 2-like isoform X2 [Alnus glutinosa]